MPGVGSGLLKDITGGFQLSGIGVTNQETSRRRFSLALI